MVGPAVHEARGPRSLDDQDSITRALEQRASIQTRPPRVHPAFAPYCQKPARERDVRQQIRALARLARNTALSADLRIPHRGSCTYHPRLHAARGCRRCGRCRLPPPYPLPPISTRPAAHSAATATTGHHHGTLPRNAACARSRWRWEMGMKKKGVARRSRLARLRPPTYSAATARVPARWRTL